MHLVRHGEVAVEGPERVYGDLEMPLSPRGVAQLEAVGEALAAAPLRAVFASALGRARIGAEAIARRHGLSVAVDEDLREISRGRWAGLTWDEVEARWPGGPAGFLADPAAYRAEGGETVGDVDRRALAAFARIVRAHDGASVAVVSHSWVLRCLLARALGAPIAGVLRVPVECGAIATLEGDARGWTVAAVNRRGSVPGAVGATG